MISVEKNSRPTRENVNLFSFVSTSQDADRVLGLCSSCCELNKKIFLLAKMCFGWRHWWDWLRFVLRGSIGKGIAKWLFKNWPPRHRFGLFLSLLLRANASFETRQASSIGRLFNFQYLLGRSSLNPRSFKKTPTVWCQLIRLMCHFGNCFLEKLLVDSFESRFLVLIFSSIWAVQNRIYN